MWIGHGIKVGSRSMVQDRGVVDVVGVLVVDEIRMKDYDTRRKVGILEV